MVRGLVAGSTTFFDVALSSGDHSRNQRQAIRRAAGLTSDAAFSIYCAPTDCLRWMLRLNTELEALVEGNQAVLVCLATDDAKLEDLENISPRVFPGDRTIVQLLIVTQSASSTTVEKQSLSENTPLLPTPQPTPATHTQGQGIYGTMAPGGGTDITIGVETERTDELADERADELADKRAGDGRRAFPYPIKPMIMVCLLLLIFWALSAAMVALALDPGATGLTIAKVVPLSSTLAGLALAMWSGLSNNVSLTMKSTCMVILLAFLSADVHFLHENEETGEIKKQFRDMIVVSILAMAEIDFQD